MSVKITWPASSDPIVASYEVQRAASVAGPWVVAGVVADDLLGPNYDAQTQAFFFNDDAGQAGNWYRLIALTAAGLRSQPSTPFQPVAAPVPLAVATARFLGVNGAAQKTTVIIGAVGAQTLGGQILADDQPLVVSSDENGRLEVPLPRGAKVRVAIEGTAFIREFVVPNVAAFDLLAAMTEAPDSFSVQTVEPLVERRSF